MKEIRKREGLQRRRKEEKGLGIGHSDGWKERKKNMEMPGHERGEKRERKKRARKEREK